MEGFKKFSFESEKIKWMILNDKKNGAKKNPAKKWTRSLLILFYELLFKSKTKTKYLYNLEA